jgi:hypothetical protein
MKNTFKPLVLLCIALTISLSTYSQSKITTLKVEFKLDTTSAVTTVEEPGMYKEASRFNVIFHVDVSKIKEIFAVEISMGSTDGGNEYFSMTTSMDAENLPHNVYVLPRQKEIVINAGKYELLPGPYYARARLRYSNGTYGEWQKVDEPAPRKN